MVLLTRAAGPKAVTLFCAISPRRGHSATEPTPNPIASCDGSVARSRSSGPHGCCPRSLGFESGARECVAQQRAAAVSRRAPGSSPKLQAGLGTGHCPVGGRTPVHKTGASLGGEVHGRWHGGVSGPKTPRKRWSWRNQASRPTAPIREVAMADAPLQRHRRSGRANIKIPGVARERLEGLDRCRVPLQSLRSRGKHGAIATRHARCLV